MTDDLVSDIWEILVTASLPKQDSRDGFFSNFIQMIFIASKYLSLHSHNGIPNGSTLAMSTRLIEAL